MASTYLNYQELFITQIELKMLKEGLQRLFLKGHIFLLLDLCLFHSNVRRKKSAPDNLFLTAIATSRVG